MMNLLYAIFNSSKKLVNYTYNLIFWFWNLVFFVTVYLGILPFVGIPLITATFDGDIALDFCITFFVLITIPLACCFLGRKYFFKKPKQLIRLFYGVEAPLFTWCLLRLFLVRELTLASGFFLGTFLVCVFIFALDLFKPHLPHWKIPAFVKIIAHSLILLMGIYLGLMLLFYTIPFGITFLGWLGNFIVAFFSLRWIEHFSLVVFNGSDWLYALTFLSFFFILFVLSASLFIAMPFALTTLYVKLGLKTLTEFAGQYNRQKVITSGVSVIGVWIILLASFNQQPQVKAFELLEKNEQQLNRQELLASSNTVRRGLVNANLSAYRYLGTTENNNHVAWMYGDLVGNKSIAMFLQNSYNLLFSPFIYQGSKQDVAKSSPIYAELFDTPLQKAERNSVRHAIKSTSIVDEAKAGLLNIDEKKVWLERQEVTLKPNGDWAEVEIHEIYNNQTPDVEEIFYYFSLPESSAITGVWLGDTEDLSQRFPFQVSPRGAAQEVYNNQVRRSRPIDPALLEQVGVGQYRLRAFPVPPRLSSDNIRNLEKQQKMHLWLTYKVMKQEQGWALPKLAQKRNIYWDRNTKRIRNGIRQGFFRNVWLEDFWQDKPSQERQPHQVELSNGYNVAVQPLSEKDYALPNGEKYALILDTSYSMNLHRQDVKDSLVWWQESLTNNDVDLYITDVETSKAQRLDEITNFNIDKQLFFGSLQTEDMLNQFEQLRGNDNYSAVLVVTDEGSYELSDDKQKIPEINSPLWMVHLGGEFPQAYNDAVLQAIQGSNGGIADDVATVIKRLATQKANDVLVVDGYSWDIAQNTNSNSKGENTIDRDNIQPITARQLVYYMSQKGNQPLSVPELDSIHQVATDYAIVTPYSSMIVLVNDEQREQLKAAEAKEDRFDREVEKGFEDLNMPSSPMEVSGVPEPDLWILFAIVMIGLGVVFYRQQQGKIIDNQ